MQVHYTLARGTYLASRWKDQSVNLYHVFGERSSYFAEPAFC